MFFPCDDGNNDNGDGCTFDCFIEEGYQCLGGGFKNSDVCQEICGDGITRIFNASRCDDGNVFAGDGCSISCDIETGWECSGGSLTVRDFCNEICADGLNAGGLECDDGNAVSGDGCSSTCSIETGYNCTGGSLFNPDTCQEICGDGIGFNNYECDDGNNATGDGCGLYCNIETAW